MSDLRKAAEMALEGFEKIHEGCGFVKEDFKEDKNVRSLATEVRKGCNKYMEALRQALAESEQKPLVWMNKYGHVASFQNEEYKDPLYTAPPKREWVGLTEEEAIDLLPVGEWEVESTLEFAKAIEAKLKERNDG